MIYEKPYKFELYDDERLEFEIYGDNKGI